MTAAKPNATSGAASGAQSQLLEGELLEQRREKLGQFFYAYREKAALSLEAVAEELALEAPETLAKYEAGKLAIPLDDVFALSNILNIPPEDVMDMIHGLYTHGAY